jgi:hypothetical protein
MFRIIWHQRVNGVIRVKWHTGTEAECNVLAQACTFAKESFWIRRPGEFK